VILIAGKGHENYQITGSTRVHFSDVEVMTELLNPGLKKS
jgi:UDP-N-acetylmuramoyl-L-alanyl-D-glutamate--2,6-diaminopimelate ligase